MLNELSERLAVAKANLRRKEKLDLMLRSARQSLFQATSRRNELQKLLKKEQSDVDALKGLSVTGLFHAMLGSKEQRMEKERQELVTAKLKFDQAVATVEDVSSEVLRLDDESSGVQDAESEYERVLLEKAELLSTNDNSAAARELLELSHQIADLTADQMQLDEAVVSGRSVLKSLKDIQATLASAANWGTLDMFGGGMLTTMVKHSKMDAAKNQARVAQQKLLNFQEELADADQRLQVSLQIDGFSKFADYFFDGLLADWMVQSKIKRADRECSQTISRVQDAITECQRRQQTVESEITNLTQRKRKLIEVA